jgi:hypothetical protein
MDVALAAWGQAGLDAVAGEVRAHGRRCVAMATDVGVPAPPDGYTNAKVESTCLRAWGAQISRWLRFRSGTRARRRVRHSSALSIGALLRAHCDSGAVQWRCLLEQSRGITVACMQAHVVGVQHSALTAVSVKGAAGVAGASIQ